MYGVKDTAATAVPAVAGAVALPATGDNTLLNVAVVIVVATGVVATLVQIGLIVYRRRMLEL